MPVRAPHLPPIAAPTRPNLLSSVSPEPRPTDGRWTEGIAYNPISYTSGYTFDPCGEVGGGTKPATEGPGEVQWDPYWIGDDIICSTFGDRDETVRRVNEAFLTKQSHLIEEVLFTNLVDSADFGGSHPNVGLSDASLAENSAQPTQAQIDAGYIWTPNAYNAFPITTAFRDMTEALTLQLGGARGMIHVEKRILPDITYAGLAVQNGQRLTTTLGDHVVVPGTGYTGAGPNAEAASPFHTWVYGTSMVEVLTSEIVPVGVGSETINRTTNQQTVRVEQLVLAHWDRQAHIAIPVCLEDPFGDCSDAGS